MSDIKSFKSIKHKFFMFNIGVCVCVCVCVYVCTCFQELCNVRVLVSGRLVSESLVSGSLVRVEFVGVR